MSPLSIDIDLEAIAARLLLATVVGMLLGLDRELRGHAAGLRTHGMVALSSAVITLSAILMFEQFSTENGQPDPIRVIQGLAQAIGFIAAGIIFVKGGDVLNLTTAANIWLATAIGIACGAGHYMLVGVATLSGLFLMVAVRLAERWLPAAGPEAQDGRNTPDESKPATDRQASRGDGG